MGDETILQLNDMMVSIFHTHKMQQLKFLICCGGGRGRTAIIVSSQTYVEVRGVIIKNTEKIWGKFPNRLDPPPPHRKFQPFLNFRHFWKLQPPPPPLGSISDIFEFQTFLIKVILQNNCKIIEIGTFLKNWDPPPGFSKFPIWN